MKKTVYSICGLALVAVLAGCVSNAVITAADSVTPQTTSMLYLPHYPYGWGTITRFDNALVKWLPSPYNEGLFRLFDTSTERGVIIPSGRHTLGTSSHSATYDFKPGGFYYVYFSYDAGSRKVQFIVYDYTEYYRSPGIGSKEDGMAVMRKMERIIARGGGRKTPAAVTASQPAAQPPLSNRDIGRLQSALQKSAQTVMGSLNRQEIIAIVSVTSSSQDMAQFVAGELEVILVNNQFPVADRNRLDAIRQEQRLQLSGDVDDNTAVSIGKFAGAKVVIVGDISGSGSMRRLRLRALNTETALVIGSASEAF
ncbi:MAG: penicillin-binding protein activator LpoB [Treponema sp.]|jgi:hypothetical protein|nr:penicillin-binding protein activator LpoB [Treponema sp.]